MAVVASGTGTAAAEPASSGERAREGAETVLWIPDDDRRLLVRGLLTLGHHPVVLEARSTEALRRWEPGGPTVLVLDAISGAERWREELARAVGLRPELGAVVLLPSDDGALRAEAEKLGARAVVSRPFGARELLEAVERAVVRGASAPRP